MKLKSNVLLIIILVTLCTSETWANIILKGKLMTDSGKPVAGTDIGVSGGPVDKTDFKGNFQINLSKDFIEGELVIITLVNKKDWVINHPLDGEWNLPNIKYQDVHTTTVVIVPYGSMALWSHARIEKHIAKLSDELTKRTEFNKPQSVDFSFYLKEWADKYGFTINQVKAQFDQWAAEVKDSDNYRTLGLRAYYTEHFASAAEHFKKAALQGEERIKALKESIVQEELATFRNWKDTGNSYNSDYNFGEALKAYRKAEKIATFEKYPRQWGEIQVRIGSTLASHSNFAGEQEKVALLVKAKQTLQKALQVFTKEHLSQQWAWTQYYLGNVLLAQGFSIEGKKGADLLAQSFAAYQNALQIFTKEQNPWYWARTQTNLGGALLELGIRAKGQKGTFLLAQAVQTLQKALQVQTKEHLPQSWADTQNNLGFALYEIGTRVEGQEGAALLEQAVLALQKALQVQTKEPLPQMWARTQVGLGTALGELGIRVGEQERAALMAQAVEAFQMALQVYTKGDFPQDWADTQYNLGFALQSQGILVGGPEGAALMAQAVEAFQMALQVYTKDHLPQHWARTHINLAKLCESQENWNAAIKHYYNGYKIFPVYAANKLAHLLHSRVFRFKEALEMNLYLAKLDDPSAKNASFRLVENYFTAGLYAEGNYHIQSLQRALKDPSYSETSIFLRVYKIANWVGLDDTGKASEQLDSLIKQVEKQPKDFKMGWNFTATKYFIRTNKALEPHCEWLLSLFIALEKTERDSIIAALSQLLRREGLPENGKILLQRTQS